MAFRAAMNWPVFGGIRTVYWAGLSPARWNDSSRYGASNSAKRLVVAVSGRITAMLPLPLAASGLRAGIAEKALLIRLSANGGTGEPLPWYEAPLPDRPPLADELGEELPLHAPHTARTR